MKLDLMHYMKRTPRQKWQVPESATYPAKSTNTVTRKVQSSSATVEMLLKLENTTSREGAMPAVAHLELAVTFLAAFPMCKEESVSKICCEF